MAVLEPGWCSSAVGASHYDAAPVRVCLSAAARLATLGLSSCSPHRRPPGEDAHTAQASKLRSAWLACVPEHLPCRAHRRCCCRCARSAGTGSPTPLRRSLWGRRLRAWSPACRARPRPRWVVVCASCVAAGETVLDSRTKATQAALLQGLRCSLGCYRGVAALRALSAACCLRPPAAGVRVAQAAAGGPAEADAGQSHAPGRRGACLARPGAAPACLEPRGSHQRAGRGRVISGRGGGCSRATCTLRAAGHPAGLHLAKPAHARPPARPCCARFPCRP